MSFEKYQRFLLSLRFFPARQIFEIILNESSKNTEKAQIEWLRKATKGFFTETKV
jgi:hypothetical protein